MAFKDKPKIYARAFLLVAGTLITAGLYFVPLIKGVDAPAVKYLIDCRTEWNLIYMMIVAFYLKEKISP